MCTMLISKLKTLNSFIHSENIFESMFYDCILIHNMITLKKFVVCENGFSFVRDGWISNGLINIYYVVYEHKILTKFCFFFGLLPSHSNLLIPWNDRIFSNLHVSQNSPSKSHIELAAYLIKFSFFLQLLECW